MPLPDLTVGISRCLTGGPVRYDGGSKPAPHIHSDLAGRCLLTDLCPEVDSGLPVPREPMRLEESSLGPRMVGIFSGLDYTPRLMSWSQKTAERLARLGLHGFVFKSGSPSCAGAARVPVFTPQGEEAGQSFGVFAKVLRQAMPDLPVADEYSLATSAGREEFLARVAAKARQGGPECR
jgi:uncharacterized protein YbbK (DUF523 family)